MAQAKVALVIGAGEATGGAIAENYWMLHQQPRSARPAIQLPDQNRFASASSRNAERRDAGMRRV